MDTKNDLNSLKNLVIVGSFIAFVLSNNGEIPVLEILNPSHSIPFSKNLHFDYLTAKL